MENESISSELIRGHIDMLILQILRSRDFYGYEIVKTIFVRSGGEYDLKEPSLYTSLKRLEKLGHISGYWGDESQGGRRKYYSLTPQGAVALDQALEKWKVAQHIINQILFSGGNQHG